MNRRHAVVVTIPTMIAALAFLRCDSDGEGTGNHDACAPADGGVGDAGDAGDAADPSCQTQPVLITTHPHAIEQDAATVGQNLVDTRGWNGRVYFGYGDLNWNTGPIVISSYDPVGRT